MKLRTKIELPKNQDLIIHTDKIMSIGSCFSENIGKLFQHYKFDIVLNPFGQLYNPASVAKSIKRIIDAKKYESSDLEYYNEVYHSYDHHSKYSNSDKTIALENINNELLRASEQIRNAKYLFLTLGSSHVYLLASNNRVVSNCHKVNSSTFKVEILDTESIVEYLSDAIDELNHINPTIKIIFTVSPIRYFALGFFENSVSKSHLFSAIYILLKKYSNTMYFPAYELLMDDLRDYRFYKNDLLHPNDLAIEYIWNKLSDSLIADSSKDIMKSIDKIVAMKNHEPRNKNTQAHQVFLYSIEEKINELKLKHSIIL